MPRSKRLALQYWKHVTLGWEPEVQRLREYAPSGGLAVDAGANAGLWTYAMANSGLFRQVIAFEPNESLTRDLLDAEFLNVRVVHKALSSERGVRRLRIPRKNGLLLCGWGTLERDFEVDAEGCDEVSVETTRLDDELVEHVCFIKIDVEGHELHVLDGARRILRTSRPVCLIECRDNTLVSARQWFSDLGAGYRQIDTRAELGLSLTGGNALFCACS